MGPAPHQTEARRGLFLLLLPLTIVWRCTGEVGGGNSSAVGKPVRLFFFFFFFYYFLYFFSSSFVSSLLRPISFKEHWLMSGLPMLRFFVRSIKFCSLKWSKKIWVIIKTIIILIFALIRL